MEVVETPFLTRAELAQRWHMAPRTLENWAVAGRGPKPRRFGKRALYLLTDVVEYETAKVAS